MKNNVNEAEEEKHYVLKKVLIAVIAFFLLALFLPYYLLGPNTISIIEGALASSKIENLTVKGDGFSVAFEKSAYENLLGVYNKNQRYEFKACLTGKTLGKDYIIDGILLPSMLSQDFAQVTAEMCPIGTLASLHSHPYRMCIPSWQDLKNFEAFKTISPNGLMMIMCKEDRFYVYRQDKQGKYNRSK